MPDALEIRDIQTLTDLRNALARFSSDVQQELRSAEKSIAEALNWLEERVRHWHREVDRARRVVKQTQADLRRCEASGYRDENGRYHQPDCSREKAALRRAEEHLRLCQENLQTAQVWRSKVNQAVDNYRRIANRLKSISGGHTESARAELMLLRVKYEAVHGTAATYSYGESGEITSKTPQVSSKPIIKGKPKEITWAEKRAILKKIDERIPLTEDEFNALALPISDLRAETLENDYVWVQQLIEAERFREATAGLWTGTPPEANWPSLAWNLLGVAADTLKVIQYWKSRD